MKKIHIFFILVFIVSCGNSESDNNTVKSEDTTENFEEVPLSVTDEEIIKKEEPFIILDSLLITPGKSIGDISLGMTKEQILKLIPYTGSYENDKWRIHSEDYERILRIDFKDNVIGQICFSYPEFKTTEGYSLENHRNNPEDFIVYESDREEQGPTGIQIIDLMYVYRSGGLAFIDYDYLDAEPEQRDLLYWGIIFIGDFPDEAYDEWKKQGEEPDPEEAEYDG